MVQKTCESEDTLLFHVLIMLCDAKLVKEHGDRKLQDVGANPLPETEDKRKHRVDQDCDPQGIWKYQGSSQDTHQDAHNKGGDESCFRVVDDQQ
eukprot:Skav204950  [mRNA]  locus=scaffold3104:35360:37223:- [translate_table: standard]